MWVRLQISADHIAFAETQWMRHAYASRDDYLNGLLNGALLTAESDTENPIEALRLPPRGDPMNDEDLPF